MTALMDDSILRFGDPLGFRMRAAARKLAVIGADDCRIFKVEARAAHGQQKEGVLQEGAEGGIWRLTADEGPAMNGTDLAPFPLGYLIAGIISDLHGRLMAAARLRHCVIETMTIEMSHTFASSGSFLQSTAKGSSEAVVITVSLDSAIAPDEARSLLDEAVAHSSGIGFLRKPLQQNEFALYINGRRRKVIGRGDFGGNDVQDPFAVHRSPPRPETSQLDVLLLENAGPVDQGFAQPVPLTSIGKRLFTISGEGRMLDNGLFVTRTWIAKPGMTQFRIVSDETFAGAAPSGLGLLSTGIAFCYLTQLHRYIEAQKLEVRAPRMVQIADFSSGRDATINRLETHLFLNGDADDDIHQNLLMIAADTCFMHAAASSMTNPEIRLVIGGNRI